MTRAVIFDFGNVLCFPPSRDKIAYAADFCGLSHEQFLTAFWDKRLDYDAGHLTPLEYWTTVKDERFAREHLETLVALEIDFWNEYDARPFAWIETLRAAGLRIGILSNLPHVLAANLRQAQFLGKPFLSFFDHVTFSCEQGCVKPQAAIYQHAIAGVGSDALFLDDKLPNVESAIHAGLHAELFTTWEEFLARDIPSLYGLPPAG